MSFLSRRRAHPGRVLVASGSRIDIASRNTAQARRKAKQWQKDAWHYRDSIGEIRYAMDFLKHACSRMRLLPAVANENGETPTPIDQAEGVPASVVTAAQDALARLTSGTHNYAALLAPYAENLEVPGECYLVGRDDPDLGDEVWGIHSIDELQPEEGRWKLKRTEDDRDPLVLDPDTAYVARLWTPHSRWHHQADSPMRALLEPCEELQLVDRMMRAVVRSRIATAGILKVPSEIDLSESASARTRTGQNGDAEDAEADPFMAELAQAMEAAIADEADPSATVPLMVRGAAEALKALEMLHLARPVDEQLLSRADKMLGRIGTGLDVPPEIITGMADANHWSAWAIDDSTFRHHVEPLVIRQVDGLTAGYYRPVLAEYAVPQEWARRIVIWYDPSHLVVRSNRAADATTGHNSYVLSDRALVEALGFDPDTDMPTEEELTKRIALRRGILDGSLTEALLLQLLYPQLDAGRHLPPGLVTVRSGEDAPDAERRNPPSGAQEAAGSAAPGGQQPPQPDADGDTDPPADDDEDGTPGPTTGLPASAHPQRELVAAAEPPTEPAGSFEMSADTSTDAAEPGPVLRAYPRESRRLGDIDRTLRERVAATADAALSRAVERAANRVRGQAQRNPQHRAVVAAAPPGRAAAALGQAVVAGLGLDPETLLDGAWDDLARNWDSWTAAARDDALRQAAALAGLDSDDPALTTARARLDEQRGTAWQWLAAALAGTAMGILYEPDSATGVTDQIGEDPGQAGRVASLVRGALAQAGGMSATAAGVTAEGVTAEAGTRLPGIATGEAVGNVLAAGNITVAAYEWVYGISLNHFEPHRALDGRVFLDFTSEVLRNPESWPGLYLAPGDHVGCHCDAMPIYADGTRASDLADAVGDATYDDSYLRILEQMADDDLNRLGLTDTTPIATVSEARRIAEIRPSRLPAGPPADYLSRDLALSDLEDAAVREYTSNGYEPINAALRAGSVPRRDQQTVDLIDAVLARNPLPADATVLREVDANVFGISASQARNLAGRVFRDDAYLSTTVNSVADALVERTDPLWLQILVPRGTPAAYVAQYTFLPDEGELLLGRGLEMMLGRAVFDPRHNRWIVQAAIRPGGGRQ